MDNEELKQSVTLWIEGLKEGSDSAAHQIWERYFGKLVKLAEKRLGNAARRIADEEDVAISVFQSLCEGAAAGRFEKLSNRDDLWSLLVAMTRMKAVDQIRRQTAKRRGGQGVRGESMFQNTSENAAAGLDQFLGEDPDPEFLMMMDEQYHKLIDKLPDESQRRVAKMRMEGFSNEEIAKALDISIRSVERKLNVIRSTWASIIE